MTEIAIGEAIAAGFDLTRRKPLVVLAWGLLQVAALAVFFSGYAAIMSNVFQLAFQQRGGPPATPDVTAFVGRMMMGEGVLILSVIVLVIVRTVLAAAIWRSVLHPEQSRWAYLRLGKVELFLLLLTFAVAFGANMLMLPLMPVVLIGGGLIAAHQIVAGIVVAVAGVIVMFVALIYLALRFSLIGPMIVDDGNFHFADAWALTRTHVGSLFAVGLALVAVILGVELLIVVVVALVGASVVASGSGDPGHMASAAWAPGVLLPRLAPFLAIAAVIAIPLTGFVQAVTVAPWARVLRQLQPRAA